MATVKNVSESYWLGKWRDTFYYPLVYPVGSKKVSPLLVSRGQGDTGHPAPLPGTNQSGIFVATSMESCHLKLAPTISEFLPVPMVVILSARMKGLS